MMNMGGVIVALMPRSWFELLVRFEICKSWLQNFILFKIRPNQKSNEQMSQIVIYAKKKKKIT